MAGRSARALRLGLAVMGLLLASVAASAEEWGNIAPGATTLEQVRARYGAPSRETRAKVEGYDTVQWLYEEGRAPNGFYRMTVEYGLVTPQGYQPTLVRALRLEPKPKVFGRNTVLQAWGIPDGFGRQGEQESLFYKVGLIITFNKEGTDAVLLMFTPPQPDPPASAAPRR
jgi:hypothetical protein